VARQLSLRGHAIEHIREDGATESTASFDERLLVATSVGVADLFRSRDDLIADAYRVRGERMAYRRPGDAGVSARRSTAARRPAARG
jgi:hypothetical protein